ncbi:hypothetical protein [Nodularia sphaerocarpa]|uniref:hypothetical protein n=1 Tax=Nodularia sphaerocarpa TaxID=137816 RepID=UPI00232FA61A|nr:hypothetical protein [Nodularia sphaerocarpa]MDB9372331.1 hypothetical protein [Nodularia sphaerocarpa CS-585]MDB9377947.1 hypothetical protein [Nodularia sphaerocarpa CS-585A2]
MNSNTSTNQHIMEITGSPAQAWGNVLIPAKGIMTVKITGDTLQGTTKTGLEKKESWLRIQNIDSVEIQEAPIYALFGLGGILFLSGLGQFLNQSSGLGLILLLAGGGIIIYAINNKRRYMAIHSYRNSIVVFMNKSPETYQQFAMTVLALCRKLNAPSNTQTRQSQTQIQA